MINFRKGNAYSLQQTDNAVPLNPSNTSGTFVAGMVARTNPSTGYLAAGISGTPLNDNLGFVGLSDTDTSVIASGKIPLFLLDGGSVIETDQVNSVTINATNFPIGTRLTANSAGQVIVSATPTTDKIIGQVYDNSRQLPTLVTVNSASGVATQVQGFVTVLSIKLAA